jgi:hypothetical protein
MSRRSLSRTQHKTLKVMFVLLYLAMMSNARAQEPQRKALRNSKAIGTRTARSVMDKDLLDVYARIMRYHKAGQEIEDAGTGNKSTLKERLTITVSDMRSGEIGELAQYMDRVMAERSDEMLNIEREEMCRILESCDLVYNAAWMKSFSRSARFNYPSLNDVDHYTAYTVTVSYKGNSRSHRGLILYYKQSQKGYQIVDGLIPSINKVSQDRLPQARVPFSQYVESRKNGSTVKRIMQIYRDILNPYCVNCSVVFNFDPPFTVAGGPPVTISATVPETTLSNGQWTISVAGTISSSNSTVYTPTIYDVGDVPVSATVSGIRDCNNGGATGGDIVEVYPQLELTGSPLVKAGSGPIPYHAQVAPGGGGFQWWLYPNNPSVGTLSSDPNNPGQGCNEYADTCYFTAGPSAGTTYIHVVYYPFYPSYENYGVQEYKPITVIPLELTGDEVVVVGSGAHIYQATSYPNGSYHWALSDTAVGTLSDPNFPNTECQRNVCAFTPTVPGATPPYIEVEYSPPNYPFNFVEAWKQVTVLKVDIVEMNFIDSINSIGASEDNNFDIVNDTGALIVPNRGPEWTTATGEIGETIYIADRKARADVKLKITPVISGTPLVMELYSKGDLDFTPAGTADHTVALTFDSTGYATHTFTTYAKNVSNVLDRKEYVITWDGYASGNEVRQHIYTLYGAPVDNYNGTVPSDPQYTHLKYLLGPKVGTQGEWCKGKSDLKESDALTSIPLAVRNGIKAAGAFHSGRGTGPWSVVTPSGGVCEDFAELMKQALLIAGVPNGKLDRKSVVSSVISRPTWFGGGAKKIIKAFIEHAGGTDIWVNEGVCGVNTDDKGMRYYDLAGSDKIGKGGWNTPGDSSDNNLWYEPPPSHGPVMYDILQELYGSWTLQTKDPYDGTANKFPQKQIQLGSVAKSGDDFTISYRTEGAKDVGVKVQMTLYKYEGTTLVEKQIKEKVIANKWDNAQDITFTITENGSYTVRAKIITSTGLWCLSMWEDNTGPVFTRP